MTERDTKTITVRAKIEAIDRFVARCREVGVKPARVLADVIEAPVTVIRPVAKTKKVLVEKPALPTARRRGYDALTGEPIYDSGVGPRGGKTK